MRNPLILSLFLLLLLQGASMAQIANDTQATGPFADIDLAMAAANPGDVFTVTGSAGGGTINVDNVTLNAATGGGADVVGPSVVDAQGVLLNGITFDAAGAEVQALIVSGGADVTATDCDFANSGTSAEVASCEVGDAIDPAGLKATGCTFRNSTIHGLHILSHSSIATLVDCTAENNANDAIHITGANSVLTMDRCDVINNAAEGVKSGADNTVMLVENSHFENNLSRDWETDSGYVGQIATFRNCAALNGDDRFCRFKGDDGEYLIENCVVDCNNIDDFIRLGDANGSTLTIRDSCVFNINGRIIRLDPDPSQVSGIGGDNTINLERNTFYNSDRGLQNETPLTTPNTWDIQYCIVAEWTPTNAAFDNQDAGSTVTENNNVLANSDGGAVTRNNVAVGANSVDALGGTSITDLFCSTVQGDGDFLKVQTSSAALNIDGAGGLAGGKTMCPATNPIVRASDAAEFADLDAAVADAGTAVGEHLYVTGSAGGGLVNKDDLTIVGPGPIDAVGGVTAGTIVAVTADGVTLERITVDDSAVTGAGANVSVSSGLTMNKVDVLNAGGNGVQFGGSGSILNMTQCTVSNSASNNLRGDGDTATVNITDSLFEFAGQENCRIEGSNHTVDVTDSTINESGNEGLRSGASDSSFTVTDCVISNGGGSGQPLGDRDHGLRIRGNNASLTVTGCLLTGNDSGIRFDSGSGQTGVITDTVIYFNGRATRVDDDHGGGGNFTYTNCTVHANETGLQTESLVPNTWDVQYCIFSDWLESNPGYGFENINGTENITENNNVYADNDVANTARLNVTAGANTEDVPSTQAVYCSQSQPNPLFLHVGTNSAANDIDGVGGVAGSKPASCVTQSPMIVTDWAAY